MENNEFKGYCPSREWENQRLYLEMFKNVGIDFCSLLKINRDESIPTIDFLIDEYQNRDKTIKLAKENILIIKNHFASKIVKDNKDLALNLRYNQN